MITNRIFDFFNFCIALCILFIFTSCESPEGEFNKAKQINTIEAYNNFLEKYPNDPLASEAKSQLARLEYLSFSINPTLDAFIKFFEKYSESNYLDSAKQKLLGKRNYDGISMKAELIEFIDEKRLADLFPGSLHLSDSTKVYWEYLKGGIVKVIGLADYIKENGTPTMIKLSFYNNSNTTKELAINDLDYVLIRTDSNKLIPAKGISGKTPGMIFPVASLKDVKFFYEIPFKDYVDFGFLFPETKKGNLIIFDSCFVTTIK